MLYETPQSTPSGFVDKAIMAFLKRNAIQNHRESFFERLHKDFWQGKGGEVFSSNCDNRFNDLFLTRQKDDITALKKTCLETKPKHLVEFGCSGGAVLNYLTQSIEGIDSATGIEINQEQVRRNQASDEFDSRIDFVCDDGGDWLLANGQPQSLFVSNGGVLEYFRRERLDQMLTHISQQLGPATFFAIEPVACDHDFDQTNVSIPFGNELSFSHNYPDLFQSNGFDVVHRSVVEFESWKMLAIIAVTR